MNWHIRDTDDLLNNLKLRILENYEISGKSQNFIELLPRAQSSPRIKTMSVIEKSVENQILHVSRSALFHMKARFFSQIYCE